MSSDNKHAGSVSLSVSERESENKETKEIGVLDCHHRDRATEKEIYSQSRRTEEEKEKEEEEEEGGEESRKRENQRGGRINVRDPEPELEAASTSLLSSTYHTSTSSPLSSTYHTSGSLSLITAPLSYPAAAAAPDITSNFVDYSQTADDSGDFKQLHEVSYASSSTPSSLSPSMGAKAYRADDDSASVDFSADVKPEVSSDSQHPQLEQVAILFRILFHFNYFFST